MGAGYEEQEGQHGELRQTGVGLEGIKSNKKRSKRRGAECTGHHSIFSSHTLNKYIGVLIFLSTRWLDPKGLTWLSTQTQKGTTTIITSRHPHPTIGSPLLFTYIGAISTCQTVILPGRNSGARQIIGFFIASKSYPHVFLFGLFILSLFTFSLIFNFSVYDSSATPYLYDPF